MWVVREDRRSKKVQDSFAVIKRPHVSKIMSKQGLCKLSFEKVTPRTSACMDGHSEWKVHLASTHAKIVLALPGFGGHRSLGRWSLGAALCPRLNDGCNPVRMAESVGLKDRLKDCEELLWDERAKEAARLIRA